jgi:hypothetical protein
MTAPELGLTMGTPTRSEPKMNKSMSIRSFVCLASVIGIAASCGSAAPHTASSEPAKSSVAAQVAVVQTSGSPSTAPTTVAPSTTLAPPPTLPPTTSTLPPAAVPPTEASSTAPPRLAEVDTLSECSSNGLEALIGPPLAGYTYDYLMCAISADGRSFVSWATIPDDPAQDGAGTVAEFRGGKLVVLNSGTADLCGDGIVPDDVIDLLQCG